jgi:hypothetical protein
MFTACAVTDRRLPVGMVFTYGKLEFPLAPASNVTLCRGSELDGDSAVHQQLRCPGA